VIRAKWEVDGGNVGVTWVKCRGRQFDFRGDMDEGGRGWSCLGVCWVKRGEWV
jgi:hypothetical protein